MSNADLAAVGLALMAANFAYQAITGHHWDVAAERTFFQWVALIDIYVWGKFS